LSGEAEVGELPTRVLPWANRSEPPTAKQINLLTGLTEQLGVKVPDGLTTRGQVTDKIGEFISRRQLRQRPLKSKPPEKFY
jgi:hypothetical protein